MNETSSSSCNQRKKPKYENLQPQSGKQLRHGSMKSNTGGLKLYTKKAKRVVIDEKDEEEESKMVAMKKKQ